MGAPRQVLRTLFLNNQFQKKNKFFFVLGWGLLAPYLWTKYIENDLVKGTRGESVDKKGQALQAGLSCWYTLQENTNPRGLLAV